MAIPLYTVVVGCANNNQNGLCRIKSLEPFLGENNYVEFNINDLKHVKDKKLSWANYVIGVVANFKGKNIKKK